jgi:hypothetical protein
VKKKGRELLFDKELAFACSVCGISLSVCCFGLRLVHATKNCAILVLDTNTTA